ncbi:MAG: aspartate-semialdehyde dehydrogenase [Francisellaceae bacterium]
MIRLGMVGWRGMVGSVLVNRMLEMNDFNRVSPVFFSTSQIGQKAPDIGMDTPALQDAYDLDKLYQMDIIISCQGSEYTASILHKLRQLNWNGYWIDAASYKRLDHDSIIVLDPLNRRVIDQALNKGLKNFIGGNCTVSLLMLALDGLIKNNLIEWISPMTYQAISGAGAKAMTTLLKQMNFVMTKELLDDDVLMVERKITKMSHDLDYPSDGINHPLAYNLLPWIDEKIKNGQTKEEFKAQAEFNKILNRQTHIPIDGLCTRVSTLRCHSQAVTLKLKSDVDLRDIESMLKGANPWIQFIENEKTETLEKLTPINVSGTLDIAVGRVRKSAIDRSMLHLFTVGDQLLWGAAEPLRRMLNILCES